MGNFNGPNSKNIFMVDSNDQQKLGNENNTMRLGWNCNFNFSESTVVLQKVGFTGTDILKHTSMDFYLSTRQIIQHSTIRT